jgi:hypothetical protein
VPFLNSNQNGFNHYHSNNCVLEASSKIVLTKRTMFSDHLLNSSILSSLFCKMERLLALSLTISLTSNEYPIEELSKNVINNVCMFV